MEKYIFSNGTIVDVPDITEPKTVDKIFKVLIPYSEEDIESNKGECVWTCCNEETFNDWQKKITDKTYFVKAMNRCSHYPGIVCDTIIPVKLNDKNQLIPIFSEIEKKFKKKAY